MNHKHTPGPWRKGRPHSVVADSPSPGIVGSDAVDYYGGHMICESVNDENARLIVLAPAMAEAAQRLLSAVDALDGVVEIPFGLAKELAKAADLTRVLLGQAPITSD